MPKRGKGKLWPTKPMDPEIKARFEALMKLPKPQPAFNPKWPIIHQNINQLWRWDNLQDAIF
jgi:hypothetical protein